MSEEIDEETEIELLEVLDEFRGKVATELAGEVVTGQMSFKDAVRVIQQT